MHAVILDQETLGDDLDFSPLHTLCKWNIHPSTDPSEVSERIADADIIVSNKVVIDGTVISRAQSLKLIAVAATGTNNIDLLAAAEAGIPVCNVRGYGGASVAQHVFTMMFALSNRLLEYSAATRAGRWNTAPHFCMLDYPIMELEGKTLGIVGYGNLGQAVAKRAACFGLQVLLAERPGNQSLRPGRIWLDDLLPQVDVLSLHCPLTPETANLIGLRELSMMKPSAFLINAARGGIVNESALVDALRNDVIGGAAVDVLTTEPPREGNPLINSHMPNLIVTPHIAWASREARQRVVNGIAANIKAFLDGNPVNLVSPE